MINRHVEKLVREACGEGQDCRPFVYAQGVRGEAAKGAAVTWLIQSK